MKNIYVWVAQHRDNGSGAAHVSMQDPSGFPPNATSWTTDPAKAIHHGTFLPGPAVGLALSIAETPEGSVDMSWWTDTITLISGSGTATAT